MFSLALKQARLFSCEERPSQQKKNPTYPFCCLLSPWFSLPPRRGPSAASWAPSAAPCCRGTGTAGLGAPGTGGHGSALGLALACTPGTAHAADACAGVKAEDGDGMEVTLEEVTAPNGLGVLLKATLAGAVTLGATAEAMGTGLTTSVGSAYVG